MAMNADTVTTPSINLSFTASAALSDNLQRVLTDLIALELVGKQIHWNVVGPNFRDIHLNLDDVVDIAREGSDEVAERMRAINAVPDGRPATIAAANFMKWLSSNQQLPQVTETLIAAGPDRDRMLNEVHTSWDGSTTDAVHIVGYKTEVRGPDEVLVNIAISQPSDHSVLTGWPLVMTWQDGDWKVKPPSNDSWGEKGVKNNSLTEDGYQKWSA